MTVILGRKPGGSGGGGGAPSGPAGGSLSGTYPDPGIANGAVDTAQIADAAVTAAKMDSGAATDGLVATADGAGGVAWEAVGGAFQFISEQVLGSDATTLNLASLPATFRHLRFVALCRTDRAGNTEDLVNIRLNNDSGNNYDYEFFQMYGTGALTGTQGFAQAQIALSHVVPAASSTAGSAASMIIDLPWYAQTTFRKTVLCRGASPLTETNDGQRYVLNSAEWRSTAAVNRITLLPANGPNFVTGSRIAAYGII